MRVSYPRAASWALLPLVLCLFQACLAQECTEIGCHSGATVAVRSISSADIRTIRACLGGDCVDLAWTRSAGCTSTNGESLNLSACAAEDDSLNSMVLDRDVHDGDVLGVQIEGENAVLLDDERTLQYQDTYPNGKDCPGHCRTTTVEL